jgi:hypothetical protein
MVITQQTHIWASRQAERRTRRQGETRLRVNGLCEQTARQSGRPFAGKKMCVWTHRRITGTQGVKKKSILTLAHVWALFCLGRNTARVPLHLNS